jgi:Tol biopolymer transport system component
LSGGPSTHLTDGSNDAAPAWSPDGESIAFVRADDSGCRLMVKPLGPEPAHEFGRCGAGVDYSSIDWLKDGSAVVVSDRPSADEPYRLSKVGLNGVRRPITSPPRGSRGDQVPKVSPDGRSVAFTRSMGFGMSDLWVRDLASGEELRLTRDGAHIHGIAWSDDSKRVFFTSDRDRWSTIWLIRATGGKPSEVAHGLIQAGDLTQSHNSIVVEVESLQANLYRAARASAAALLEGASSHFDWEPDYNQKGELAFLSNRSGNANIWVQAPGGDPRQVTHRDGGFLTCPRWSPDGRSLLFLDGAADGLDVAVLDPMSGRIRRLTRGQAYRLYPTWSHDQRFVYFSADLDGRGWRIWRQATSGGAPSPFTDPGWRSGRESPDGQWFYAVKAHAPGLWRRPIAGGPFDLVVPGLAAYDGGAWAIEGEKLYYVARAAGGTEIRERSLSSGRESVVVKPEVLVTNYFSCYGLAARPDGSVVYAEIVHRQGDLYKVKLGR